jgi:DNA primase
MRQRLAELTGIGGAGGNTATPPPLRRAMANPRNTPAQKPSLIRTAITHVLLRPNFALALQPPYHFAALHLPGIELLSELVLLVRDRPDLSTGSLLEHFAGRDELPALQKLALLDLPGNDADLRTEFLDTIRLLEKQVGQQRIDTLQQRYSELDASEKRELLELLQARLPRPH